MKCKDCEYLVHEPSPICTGEGKGALRKCIHALTLSNFQRIIKPGWVVLEVGCGWESWARSKVLDQGADWYGIDPQYEHGKGRQTIRSHAGTAEDIPFGRESFDFVFANQSMEHWRDFGETMEDGLAEIWRVLKPAGKLMVNVPIHLHGNSIFVYGVIPEIKVLFTKSGLWKNFDWQDWRKEYKPLEPCYPWHRSRGRKPERYEGLPNDSSSWIFNVVCEKRKY